MADAESPGVPPRQPEVQPDQPVSDDSHSPSVEPSWRKERQFRRLGPRLTKFVALVLPAVLLILLVLVLVKPFHHPRVHLFTLTDGKADLAKDSLALFVPTQDFLVEDLQAMESLSPLLYRQNSRQGPVSIDSIQETGIHTLGELLSQKDVGPDDHLMLYIRAEGTSEGEQPYLVWSFEPEQQPMGRFRLRELLTQLAQFPAREKIILLDSGDLTHDPRLGMVVNQFPQLLRAEVERTGDPHLWVLSSHRMLQSSHRSLTKAQSLFAYYVTRGLQGEADLDSDQTVDLDELYRYVSASVDMHVREKSDDNDSQTPVLLWGRGTDRSQLPETGWPKLVPVLDDLTGQQVADSKEEETKTAPSRKTQFQNAARLSPLRPVTPVVPPTPTATVPRLPVVPSPVPSLTPTLPSTQTVANQAQQKAVSEIQQASLSQEAPTKVPKTQTATGESPATDQSNAKPKSASDSPAGGTAKSEPVPLPETVPELFSKIWELRDRLASHESPVPRPLDYAPHLWRTFQAQMIAYERVYLAGAIADQGTLSSSLQAWVVALERLAEDRTDLAPNAPVLVRRMVALRPQNPLPDDRVFSLGMLELRGRLVREPLPAETQLILETFDRLTTQGTPEEFVKWLDGLPRDHQQYLEIRLAYRLRPFVNRHWPLIQLALRTRRRAEQVPTQEVWAQVWIDRQLAQADQMRLEGEREFLDQASLDWRSRAEDKLHLALDEYDAASRAIQMVSEAKRLRHDLLERLPWYVEWWHAAGDVSGPSSVAPGANQLATLVEILSRQSELLEHPDSQNVAELSRLHRRLGRLQTQIETPLQNEFVSGLVNGPAADGDEWRIAVLLRTPLPNRETRMQLLQALWTVDEQLENRLPQFYIPDTISNGKRGLTGSEWERLDRRAELDARLAELAALHPADDAGAAKRVKSAYSSLEEVRQQAGNSPDTEESQRFLAYANLGDVLREFYSTLPGRVGAAYRHNENLSNEAMRTMCLCALRATDRAIRLVAPRDVVKTTDFDPIGLLRRAEAADLLAWQYDRLNKTGEDAQPNEAQYLATAAQIYRNELSELPRTAPPLILPSPLELNSESQVVVPTTGTTEVQLQLNWKGIQPTDVWLVLKYDPTRMDVRETSETPVYQEDRLRQLGLSYPFQPAQKDLPRTLRLKSGESKTLRFRIQAKANAEDPVPLIFKAVTANQYLRKEMQVLLPFPELFHVHPGGILGSWSLTPIGLTLHPYPNQETNFQLRLSSESDGPRTVDVELATLKQPLRFQLPRVALSPEAAAEWAGRLGPQTSLVAASKVAVPANGESIGIPFPVPKTNGEATAPMPLASESAKGEKPPETAPKIEIPQGLLLTITDLASGRKVLKHIQLAPQRPRRYLQARVGYNLDRERIDVAVQMKDPESFPPNGVRISGELAEGLEPGWTAQLAGRLQTPNDVAHLVVNIPEQQGRVVTLRLHADGFPRAFVFRVPCDMDSENLPEETTLHAVRITAPADGSAYPVPTGSVPVVFEVDAPQDAFQTRDEMVQVGIDRDRDRTFLGDDPLQFASDRQVQHRWVKAGADGWITLESTVQDFHVNVPTRGLENAEVNLLANLITPTKTSWSLSRKLVFDGVGPRLVRPELNSGDPTIGNVVTQGKDMAVSVRAGDFAKSGVVKVEAAFDVAGIGKFAPEPPPVPAKRGENDRWTALLGTGELKPGTYNVLFRATDRVGNQSDYVSTTVQIITPEEAKKRKQERTNVLSGVILDGKNPAPRIKVTLTPDLTEEELKKLEAEKKKPVSIPPTTTDPQGRFVFPNVRIGDYKITVEGITRGLRRKQEATLTIPAPPTRLKTLEMRIDKPPAS